MGGEVSRPPRRSLRRAAVRACLARPACWLVSLLVVLECACASPSEAPESLAEVATTSDPCVDSSCGDGRCDGSELAPWGSVCPQDCRRRFARELQSGPTTYNEYCDQSAVYLSVFGSVPSALRVPVDHTPQLDAAHQTAVFLVAPQEYCPTGAPAVEHVFLEPAADGAEAACRGVATRYPQLTFELLDRADALRIGVKMRFPVALIVRGPDGSTSCVDVPYREVSLCAPGHLEQYRSRGGADLAIRVEHPLAGAYSVWVTRLSYWDGMGRGEVSISIAEGLGVPAEPSQPPPPVTPALEAPAPSALPPSELPPVADVEVPAAEDLTVEAQGQGRGEVEIEATTSPGLLRAEGLIDRCQVLEGDAQRQLGREGLALLEHVGAADRIAADTLRRRLRACAEAHDVP